MIKPPAISRKPSQVGEHFTNFQMDRLVNNVSPKTLELYENSWKFFGPDLDKVRLDLKGKKGDDLMRAERVVLDTLKLARAKAKLQERSITPISINIYGRVMNTFLRFLQTEGVFTNRFVLEPLQEETGDRREFFRDDEILKLQNYRPKSFNQTRAWTIAADHGSVGLVSKTSLRFGPVDVASRVIFGCEKMSLKHLFLIHSVYESCYLRTNVN